MAADGSDVWYNALPRMLTLRGAADYLKNKQAFYSRDSLLHCPTAPLPANATHDNYVYFSIAMNSKLIQGTEKTIKTTTILKPSQTVVFLENLLDKEKKVDSAQSSKDLGQPSSYANRFAARHDGSGNLAFVDGHAATFKGNQVVQTQPGTDRGKAILPQLNIIWTADPIDNPNN